MNTDKLDALSVKEFFELLKRLQKTKYADDPGWANDFANSYGNGKLADDLASYLSWADPDGTLDADMFPEPVTVTKTTTSVGATPPADLGDTPEEKDLLNQAVENGPSDDFYSELDKASTPEEVDNLLKKYGIDPGNAADQPPADMGDTPEEKEMLEESAKEDKPAEEPKKEDKPSEEPAKEDKPAEEPKKEDKPSEEPAKEDKPDDTMKNITSALSNRI